MSSIIYMFFNIRITIFCHNNLIPSLQAPTCSGYAERKNIRHTKFTNHIIGGEHRVGGFSWSVERCGGWGYQNSNSSSHHTPMGDNLDSGRFASGICFPATWTSVAEGSGSGL